MRTTQPPRKRRADAPGGITERKNQTPAYAVWCPVLFADGTSHRVYRYAHSSNEATKVLARLRRDIRTRPEDFRPKRRAAAQKPADPIDVTVSYYLATHLPALLAEQVRAGEIRERHAAETLGLLTRHALPAFGSLRITDVRQRHVTGMLADMPQSSSDSTRANTVGAVRKMLVLAEGQGIYDADHLAAIRRPRRRENPEQKAAARAARTLTDEQRNTLAGRLWRLATDPATVADQAGLAVLSVLMLWTGCRRGEAIGARIEDFELGADGTWHISRSVVTTPGRGWKAERPKTVLSDRVLDLDPELVSLLRGAVLRSGRREGWLVENPLRAGEPVSPHVLSRFLTPLLREVGLAAGGAHSRRHAFAFAALAAREGDAAGMLDVSRALGHADLSTTTTLYAAVNRDGVRKAVLGAAPRLERSS